MKLLQNKVKENARKTPSQMRRKFNEMQMAKWQMAKEKWSMQKMGKMGERRLVVQRTHNRVTNANACLALSRQNGLIGRRQKGAN